MGLKLLSRWIPIADVMPPEGVPVLTKIDDEHGPRNEQVLKRQGRLWFIPDGSVYVYYTPTHFIPPSVEQRPVG